MIEIIGFDHSIFATNLTLGRLRIGYVGQVSAITPLTADCSATERSQLFHDTEKQFYQM